MGLSKALQQELQSLKTEGGKRNAKIRDAAERVDRQLREIADAGAENDKVVAAALRDFDETLLPGLLAMETKVGKCINLALSYVQRLASYEALDPDQLHVFGQSLRSACDSTEDTQLKIIQTITTIMQSPSLLASHKITFQMAECLLVLYNNRTPSISNAAAATIQQSVSSVFENIEAVQNSSLAQNTDLSNSNVLSCLENAADLFREITIITDKGSSKELKFKQGPSQHIDTLCLDVIDTCIRSNHSQFVRFEILETVLNDYTFPMILNKLLALQQFSGSKKETPFPICVRIMRVAAAFLSSFPGTSSNPAQCVLLNKIISSVTSISLLEQAPALRALALEAIFAFTSHTRFPERFRELQNVRQNSSSGSADTSDGGFISLIQGLHRCVYRNLGPACISSASPAVMTQTKAILEALAASSDENPRIRVLNMIGHCGAELPSSVVSESALIDLALCSMHNIIKALSELCGISLVPFDDEGNRRLANKPACDLDVLVRNVAVVRDVIDGAWEFILEALHALLLSVLAPCFVQRVLRAYAAFTHTCGALQLVGPRDRALAPLCKYAVPGPGADGAMAPLYAHHMLICRALLSLTYDLGGVLGDSWVPVLEALHRLDAALADRGYLPRQQAPSEVANAGASATTEAGSREAGRGGAGRTWNQGQLEAELGRLRRDLDALFEQTDTLDEATAVQLLQALSRVSLASISDARPDILPSSAARGERLFGTEKMLDMVRHNLFRLGRLWEPTARQLSLVCTHGRRAVRQYGMASMTQLVLLGFRRLKDARQATAAAGGVEVGLDEDGDLERRLVGVLEELYRSGHGDTRDHVLDGVYAVLQACGEDVGPAWPMLLALLKGVAQDKEAQAQDREGQQLRRAFMCVQLVRNDLLSALPVDCLQLFLTTLGAFGSQEADLNISLTAITLLWNVADFFGRERPALASAFAAVGATRPPAAPPQELEGVPAGGEEGGGEVAEVDLLWLVLYQQLRVLALDGRLEVRHSALRTLLTALETHGAALEPGSWPAVVHGLLLRVLADVRRRAAAADDVPLEQPLGPAGAAASPAGGDGGRGGPAMLLIHHSRNTVGKQWQASLELCVQGVLRVLGAFLPRLCSMPGADAAWCVLLSHLRWSLVEASEPVVAAAAAALRSLVAAAAPGAGAPGLPRAMWGVLWKEMRACVGEACRAPAYAGKALRGVLVELVEVLGLPGYAEAGYLDRPTLLLALGLLDEVLGCSPAQPPAMQAGLRDAVAGGLRHVVRAASRLDSDGQLSIWAAAARALLGHLGAAARQHPWPPSLALLPEQEELEAWAAAGEGGAGRAPASAVSELGCEAAGVLAGLVEAEAPADVQARLVEPVAGALLAAMTEFRHERPDRAVWRAAAAAWTRVVRAGGAALRDSGEGEEERERVVMGLAEGLHGFLFPGEVGRAAGACESAEEAAASEAADVELAGFAAQELVHMSESRVVAARVLGLLDAGAAALQEMPGVSVADPPAAFRFRLAQASMAWLHTLVAGPAAAGEGWGAELARLAAPLLVCRCRTVLEAYVEDEAAAGMCPLPRARLDQAVSAARTLEGLRLPPALAMHLLSSFSLSSDQSIAPPSGPGPGRSGWRGHLVAVYPSLCRCIAATNPELRRSVRTSLELVGWELGLLPGDTPF